MSTHVQEDLTRVLSVSEREIMPVGIAVVGAGYWGPNLVRNALRQGPIVELLGVAPRVRAA